MATGHSLAPSRKWYRSVAKVILSNNMLSNVLEWHRTVKFGMSILLSSLAPLNGEVSLVVSLVRSHSVMAVR